MTTFRILVPAVLFVFLSPSSFAQIYRWSRYDTAGKTSGSQVILLPQSEISIIGTSGARTNEGADILLAVFGIQSSLQWAKLYGGEGSEEGVAILQTKTGFLLLGTTTGFNSEKKDILLIDVDLDGVVRRSRVYGGRDDDQPYGIKPVRSGGYMISGTTRSFGTRGWAAFLLKISENGDVEWFRLYDNWNTDAAADFVQTADNGFVATGWSYAVGGGMHDVLVFKTSETGELLWSNLFGGRNDDGGISILELPGQGYLVNANTHSLGHGEVDALILRLTEEGNLVWAKAIGMDGEDIFRGSLLETDTTVILAGWHTVPELHQKRLWIARMSVAGSLTYSGIAKETHGMALDVVQRGHNIFVLTGEASNEKGTGLILAEASLSQRGRVPSGLSMPIMAVSPMSTRSPMRMIQTELTARDVSPSVHPILLDVSYQRGSLETPGLVPERHAIPRVRKDPLVIVDSAQFIRTELSRIAEEWAKLAQEINCDFTPVERALERSEAALHIGDLSHSTRILATAESLLISADCGPVSIEELTALGSLYDRKSVEVTASVVTKAPSPAGDGYRLALDDGTGTLTGFYSGRLREVSQGDEVLVKGFFDQHEANLNIESITRAESSIATGLLMVFVAMLLTGLALGYRLRRRRHIDRSRPGP